jgi:bifunctional non-homologous end joining protein LigD
MMASLAPAAPQRQAQAKPGLEHGAFVTPMSYTTASEVLDSPETIFEMDYGGYRVQLVKAGNHVMLRDRSGRDCGARFPAVVAAARALELGRAMLDGEIVVLDALGKPDRASLAAKVASKRADGVAFIAFDILAAGEVDVRRRPLSARKALLAKSLACCAPDGVIRLAPCVTGDGRALLRQVASIGGDGVIAKDARSVYRSGRSQAWRRIPITSEAPVVVVGYMPSSRRNEVASLLVAERNGGFLVFRGRDADGLKSQATSGWLRSLPDRHAGVPAADVQGIGNGPKGARWINPCLRATIRYKSRSPAGHILGGELIAILGEDAGD